MKKIFRILSYVVIAALMLSCGEAEPVARTASPAENTVQAYFLTGDSGNVETQEYLDPAARSIPVIIARVLERDENDAIIPASAPEITVNVSIDDKTGLFTIPETVTIAAGKETATFNITIANTVETGINYMVKIRVADNQGNVYGTVTGAPELTKKFMLVKWVDLGEVTVVDGFLEMLGIPEYKVHVFWGESTIMYKIPGFMTDLSDNDAVVNAPVDFTFNIDAKNTFIADGPSATLGGSAVRIFDSGLPVDEVVGPGQGTGNILLFTDISEEYSHFDAKTRKLVINSYYGFKNLKGTTSGWGWKDMMFTLPALPSE